MQGYTAKYKEDEKDTPQSMIEPKNKGQQKKCKMDSNSDAEDIK